MIDIGIYAALGFLAASLIALLLMPPLWKRAVRLTTRKLEATMPMSVSDIQADKDQLRAEYAIQLRRVEMALEKAKEKAIREQVEANKRRVRIAEINAELAAAKATLQENENANRVLEQTIKRRLPDLDNRLKAAKEVIAQLETTNVELRHTADNQAAALKVSRNSVQTQRRDIEQLRKALEGGTGRLRRIGKSETKEIQTLSAELSRVREELEQNRVRREENEALRQELNRLATQILAVAKGQGIDLPHIGEEFIPMRGVRDLTETVAAFKSRSAPTVPEPMFPHGNGAEQEPETELEPERFEPGAVAETEFVPSLSASAEDVAIEDIAPEPVPHSEAEPERESVEQEFAPTLSASAEDAEAEREPTEEEIVPNFTLVAEEVIEQVIVTETAPAEETQFAEPSLEDTQPEPTNGEVHHGDATEATNGEVEPDDEVSREDDNDSPKGPLARRLAARRAKRRGRKSSGLSLSERLRGIPAEFPEN